MFAVVLLAACAMVSGQYVSYPFCKYTFCGNGPIRFKVGQSGEAFTGHICKGRKPVGIINFGFAYHLTEDPHYWYFNPIEHWEPRRLKQNFSPSFFKTFKVGNTRSGVGHETPQQNQLSFLNRRTFVLPLKSVQHIDHTFTTVKNDNHPHHAIEDYCIVFQTRT